VSDSSQPVPVMTAADLKARMDAGDAPILIDVRNPDEWDIASIDGAIRISLPQVQMAAQQIAYFGKPREETVLAQVPTDQTVVVHCHHGGRSEYAIMILREVGYDAANLINLEGGIDAWSVEADPSVARY
jgi:sulfur-carrier protein adenylyltransferase/sulfurtransferase